MFGHKSKEQKPVEHIPCEICGYLTIDTKRGLCTICPVCFWEDDGLHDDPDEPCEGPNGDLSVNQAKTNYKAFGACSKDMIHHVRGPLPTEHPGLLRSKYLPTLCYLAEDGKVELEVIFDITGLETYGNTTEGWLRYNLVIQRNGTKFVGVAGTVHNNDVCGIEELIENGSKRGSNYEPLEPDFKIRVEGDGDMRSITWMVNHGLASDNAYDDATIGVSIPADKQACKDFVEKLRGKRLGFVKNLKFRNFDAVDLPS